MKIPKRVSRAVKALSEDDRNTTFGILTKIAADPLSGSFLPFPHQPGTLGLSENGIFVTYRLNDGDPEIGAVQKMPDISDLFGAVGP